jgi:hypothetical protein
MDFRVYQRAKPASGRGKLVPGIGVRGSPETHYWTNFGSLRLPDAGVLEQGKVNHGT